MKRLLATLALIAALPQAALAQTPPQPPEVAARAYILLDLSANQPLAAREADTTVEPASLTKLMTAYLVFQALRDKKLALDPISPSGSASPSVAANVRSSAVSPAAPGSSSSTNTRSPSSVGTRPADVCGCSSSPRRVSSAIVPRMLAGESCTGSARATDCEPTGDASPT